MARERTHGRPAPDRTAARLRIVEEHIACENAGDLDGILATFGEAPSYEDESWGERYDGQAAVRGFYETLIAALPDLSGRRAAASATAGRPRYWSEDSPCGIG